MGQVVTTCPRSRSRTNGCACSNGKLLETAGQYKSIVEKDRAEFDKAADEKSAKEVEGRVHQIAQFEKDIAENSRKIQELTEAINKAQASMKELKDQAAAHEQKIAASRQGYDIACDAMINKISTDIQKIQTSI